MGSSSSADDFVWDVEEKIKSKEKEDEKDTDPQKK